MMTQKLNANLAAMAYRRAASSVAPMTAVVMLYDKAIVSLHRAVKASQDRRADESFAHASHAAAILRGLSYALDFERGGDMAESLRATYTGNILALLNSFGKPDMPERYGKLASGLAELRDAWAVVARLPTKAEEAASRQVRAVGASR
jgi:flagellar secretion chaperone FliS